jgi:hypothetical protein
MDDRPRFSKRIESIRKSLRNVVEKDNLPTEDRDALLKIDRRLERLVCDMGRKPVNQSMIRRWLTLLGQLATYFTRYS